MWLTHNIRTLPCYESVGPSRETYKLRILCAYAQRGQKLHEFAIDYITLYLCHPLGHQKSNFELTFTQNIWMLLQKKSMDHIMFWINTQRRWCTLTSYNYLGQFNNFNKLRQYDWSKFWCFCTYSCYYARYILSVEKRSYVFCSHVLIFLAFNFKRLKEFIYFLRGHFEKDLLSIELIEAV